MKPFYRVLLCAMLSLTALGAMGQQSAVIRKNLAERIPQFQNIDEVRETGMKGLYEVRVGSEIYYTDAGGNYLIDGHLIDTRRQRNLTQERVDQLTAVAFKDLPFKDAFTIVRGNGARKLAVFEDPNCGYCKRFERDLQKINNITVYLFLYPILSPDSKDKSNAIWCSADRAKAWQDWMVREQPTAAAPVACDTAAVERNYQFGRARKVDGTPTLFFPNNTRVPGAMEAQQVEKMLSVPAS